MFAPSFQHWRARSVRGSPRGRLTINSLELTLSRAGLGEATTVLVSSLAPRKVPISFAAAKAYALFAEGKADEALVEFRAALDASLARARPVLAAKIAKIEESLG